MNKNESKYFHTAELMDEALLQLLLVKDFDYISVKELCTKAGVNRSTFYLHYESMDDLLVETIGLLNKRFLDAFKSVEDKGDVKTTVLTKGKYLTPYLLFIKENLKAYKLIHEKPHLFHNEKTFQYLYESIFDEALTNFGVSDEEKPFVFAFYTQGALGVINTWIQGGCKEEVSFIVSLIERNTFVSKA
ncbi:MAG: TetR/AcrR family transcriptional regulator [Bacilli bacterium]|nr:TetR/AcrR family transcriptional regulator [Bacilli bacterium]